MKEQYYLLLKEMHLMKQPRLGVIYSRNSLMEAQRIFSMFSKFLIYSKDFILSFVNLGIYYFF
jgi:hypothetical protein